MRNLVQSVLINIAEFFTIIINFVVLQDEKIPVL